MRQPLVAGNWKMNGSLDGNKLLLDGIKAGVGDVKSVEVVVCAPAVYLSQLQQELGSSGIAWGAQDLSAEAAGAYTGELAAPMLREFGCSYVIVGHSERRAYHGEGDQLVARKYAAARAAGLVPILCVGETLREREQGVTESVVARQLDAVIELEGVAALADGVVAYEPVWAIGTGKSATPEQAQDVHAFIRSQISALDGGVAEGLRILYGGSMKPENAAELMAKSDIDGGLIGGAALNSVDFVAICTAAG